MHRCFALVIALAASVAQGCRGSSSAVRDAGAAGSAGGGGGRRGHGGGLGGGPGGTGVRGGSGTPVTIVVDTPSGRTATASVDGYCDILEAIEAADTDRPVHECPAGNGADRILLTAGATYPTPRTLRITSAVTIDVADLTGGRATIVAAAPFTTVAGDGWSS